MGVRGTDAGHAGEARIRIFSSELTSLTYQIWWSSSPWRSDSSPTRVGYVVEVSEILLNMQGNSRTARNPGKIIIGRELAKIPMPRSK